MKNKGKAGTLLVALGFLLSVLVVVSPAGAAAGRAEQFVVSVMFTNPDGSNDNSSEWMEMEPVNITANVSIASMMENATDLMLELSVNGELEGTPVSMGALDEGDYAEHTWQWHPMEYGDFEIMVTAVNGTDTDNQTVVTLYYMSMASDIIIESVTLSAYEALIGVDTVTVTASLTNNGNMDGIANVTFGMDQDVVLGNKELALPAGESGDVTLDTDFSGLDLADGEHTVGALLMDWTVSMVMSDMNVTLTNPMANVVIDMLAVDPASAYEGAEVTFTATLNNTGTADAADLMVDFYDGATMIGNVTNISVAMGETKDVTFMWMLPDVTADTEKTVKAMLGDSEASVNVTVMAKMPMIMITSFSVPDGMMIGDMVDFTAVIKNNGTGDATGVVVEFYDGTTKLANSTALDLVAGNSTTVTLKVTISGTPDTDHTFFAKAAGAEMNVTKMVVHVPLPASVGIVSFSVKPTKKEGQPADSTQSYTLTVVLKNTGELTSTNCTLTVTEGSKNIATESISLDANSTVTKTYTWKVKGSGGHTATATLSGSEAGTPATMTTKCTLEYTPGFEVLFLVAAIFVAALLVRRRKN